MTPIKLHSPTRPITPQPIFGERRSPTCVLDWLEVNDFSAFDYDENIVELKIPQPSDCNAIKQRKSISIKTKHLQRERSFRAFPHASGSVRSMVKTYSKQINFNLKSTIFTANFDQQLIQNESNNVKNRLKSYDQNNNCNNNNNNYYYIDQNGNEKSNRSFQAIKTSFDNQNKIMTNTKANNLRKNYAPIDIPIIVINRSESILSILKRKKEKTLRYVESTANVSAKKQEILKSLSTINSAENSKYLDAFSLDGEFV